MDFCVLLFSQTRDEYKFLRTFHCVVQYSPKLFLVLGQVSVLYTPHARGDRLTEFRGPSWNSRCCFPPAQSIISSLLFHTPHSSSQPQRSPVPFARDIHHRQITALVTFLHTAVIITSSALNRLKLYGKKSKDIPVTGRGGL
jgi:hypothetical protein